MPALAYVPLGPQTRLKGGITGCGHCSYAVTLVREHFVYTCCSYKHAQT